MRIHIHTVGQRIFGKKLKSKKEKKREKPIYTVQDRSGGRGFSFENFISKASQE